jgi:hypothetical protein
MKKHLLFLASTLLLATPLLFAQISNTETVITLASSAPLPSRVCFWNNIPSSGPGNVYQVYIEFEDGDNLGAPKRLPATGYYNCTVTNTPNSFGPNIVIDAPAAAFPTPSNTIFGWSLVDTKGKVTLLNTSTNVTTHQIFEYDQYVCPALPIYLSYFRLDPSYNYGSSGVDFLKFEWESVDESDYLSHYILQKSYNNFTWTDEVLQPAKTGIGFHYYTVYANKHAPNPNVWYRLKWIGEYGFAKTTQSIKPTGIAGPASNIICNYAYISGPDSLCPQQSAVYKLNNAPATGAMYSWNATGATIDYLSQNNLTANVTLGSGNASLYANSANSSCNKSRNVTVLGTGSLNITHDYAIMYPTYTEYHLSVNMLPGTTGSQYTWYRDGVNSGTGQTKVFNISNWCDTIEVKLNTSCGEMTGTTEICFLLEWDPCDTLIISRMQDQYKVGPVPANDKLTISLRKPPPCDLEPARNKADKMSSDIYTIQVYDMFGNLKLERRNISLKTEQQLDVHNLPTGNYILYMKNAQNIIRRQVRIER